jgi:hypothetical protein
MANLLNSRLDTPLSDADLAQALDLLAQLQTLLPAVGLTETERKRLLAMNVTNREATRQTLIHASGPGADILPAYISVDGLRADFALFEQADRILQNLEIVTAMVRDLRRLAAHEAYGGALAIYNHFGIAAKAGVPGADSAAESLEPYFKREGGGRKPKPGVEAG